MMQGVFKKVFIKLGKKTHFERNFWHNLCFFGQIKSRFLGKIFLGSHPRGIQVQVQYHRQCTLKSSALGILVTTCFR